MSTTWVGRRLWLVYLVVGLVVAVAILRLPEPAYSIVYDLVGLSAVAAILAGMRLHRPARRGIWYGLAGGLTLFVAGDVVYTVSDYVLHVEPFPGPADVLYLTSYPLLAGALLVLIRSRTGGGTGPG